MLSLVRIKNFALNDFFTATKEHQNAGRLSATGIALQLVRQRGIGGLYKGTGATMARDVTFSIVYFPLFAYLNSLGPRKKDGSGEAVFWASFVAGNVAGAFAATFVTPLDGKLNIQSLIFKCLGGEKYFKIRKCGKTHHKDKQKCF